MRAISAFIAGFLFAVGLIVSQMVNPAKVLNFLDLAGSWDPSLAFVMIGAIAASSIGVAFAKRRGIPVLGGILELPTSRDFDARLIGGAALFGMGWGLVGLCPGPAVAGLSTGLWQSVTFLIAMLVGMVIFAALPSRTSMSSSSMQKVDA